MKIYIYMKVTDDRKRRIIVMMMMEQGSYGPG